MRKITESLAGRVGLMELESLSWEEARTNNDPLTLQDFIWRGGFPELSRLPDFPKEAFFESYTATYLERDVRQVLNVGSLRDFDRFIRLLATRNAQQLDMTNLGRELGITTKTAGSWISVLESTGIISLLEPWYGNLGKRIVKTPKVYFNDTGLVTWLLGLEPSSWQSGPFLGSIWETFIFAELRKAITNSGNNTRIYYYRDNQGLEVDFLLAGGTRATAIEAKAKSRIDPGDLRNLQKFRTLALEASDPSLTDIRTACACLTGTRYDLPQGDYKVAIVRAEDLPGMI
jgi:uncharacterized protein